MAKAPPCICIDFETKKIQQRSLLHRAPEPIGFSIQEPGQRVPEYFAWGHASENNCDKNMAKRRLKAAWSDPRPKLFYNGKFDVEVATTHMDMKMLPWDKYHDALFVMYLIDPHAKDLKLKFITERLLGEAPEEKDELVEWIVRNVPGATKKTAMEFMEYTPAGLAGRYANGDVSRTIKLFKKYYPEICDRGMLPAYDREREVMPILLENEQVGMRVDQRPLARDVKLYTAEREKVDAWLIKRLKTPGINLNSNEEFAEALARNKLVPDDRWVFTKDGKRSVSKTNFTEDMITDKKVHQAYGYRNRLGTCLNMFMIPWLEQARENGGHITTNWNQVRQPGGGTRTGRPSTDHHNFLNISKTWDDKEDGYVHPSFMDLLELPLTRRYVLPDAGGVFCHRDYNQQELRILAHFEDGALMEAYLGNLRLDVHDFVRDLILDITGQDWPRRPVKIVNFRTVYGGGAPATAAGVGCSMEEAKRLLAAHAKALPGVKGLKDEIKAVVAGDEPIVTWGGRQYYVEPPGWSAKYGRHMTYEYKLLNYLVQGSAADATKQALINYHNHPKREGRFLVTVYDEINVSARDPKREMAVLRESMESLEFDVPLLTDGKTGPNWGSLKKFAEPPSIHELRNAA